MRFREPSLLGAWNCHPFREARFVWVHRGGGTPAPAAPNPAPEPEPPMLSEREVDARKLQDIRDFARGQYHDAMDTAAVERSNAEAVSLRVTKNIEKIEKIQTDLQAKRDRAEQLERTSSEYSGLSAKLAEINNDLTNEKVNLIGFRNVANRLGEWERGSMSPTEFADYIESLHQQNLGPNWQQQDAQNIAADVRAVINSRRGVHVEDPLTSGELPDISNAEMWEQGGIDQTVKQLVINHLSPVGGVPEKLAYINARLNLLEQALKERGIEDIAANLEKAEMPPASDDKGKSGAQSIAGALNIEFFSVRQIIDGFKKWKDAYTDSLKGYNNSKANRVAKKVGKMFSWLPFGEDVNKNLSDKVANDQAKERKDFIEAINTRELGFNDLFGDGGELSKSTGSPSNFLAMLEFASQKGWLYPLMKYNFIDDKSLPGVEVFGFNVRSVIPQDYMSDDILASTLNGFLNKSNANGNKDMQEQMVIVEGKNDIDSYIALFDKAMKGNGYWKAIGIMRGALKKAKDPATSAIFAARLNFWLRNQNVGRYINDTILSKFGEASFNQVPYSMAFYALDAGKIQKWSKDGKPNEASDDISQSVMRVEQVIDSRGGQNLEPDAKAKLVGRVLAGQVVELSPGNSISLFEPMPGFAEIRDNANKIWPLFEDFDMRTAAGGYFAGSEIVLLPESFLNSLFELGSTGQPSYPGKIVAYAGGIIDSLKKLELAAAQDPRQQAALVTFRRETKRKLDTVIRSKIVDRNPKDLLKLPFSSDPPGSQGLGLKGHYVLEKLLDNDLLSYSTLGLTRPANHNRHNDADAGAPQYTLAA